ncbi:MAG TPA: hypothetical protein GXX75_23505 [Clostridiales bacterium]|nr:hypothetical protein [Clostridiales bacterium]
MAAYMITYDLNSAGQKYEEVIKAIKDSASAWCTYWKSAYLIKSNLTANQISDKITPHLDNNDRMIVIEVKSHYQGWLAEEDWKYIREHIFN